MENKRDRGLNDKINLNGKVFAVDIEDFWRKMWKFKFL